MIKPIKFYKSINTIDSPLSAFQPIFIEKPKFSKDIFQKQFSTLDPEKRTLIQKFANIEEFYKLTYKIWDLKTIAALPVEKITAMFSMASMKDSTLLLRFTPSELFKISQLSVEKLKFLKPAARQKDINGRFNFSFAQLTELSKFNSQEIYKSTLLLDFNLPAKDLIAICKDNMTNAEHLRQRLQTLNKLFQGNIYETRVVRSNNNYVISLTKKDNHTVSYYVFDKKFNPLKNIKSDVDFTKECFTPKAFFRKYFLQKNQKNHKF